MISTWPTRPGLADARLSARIEAWLAERRTRRLKREAERDLAELPPHLLRDVGLVDLARARENGGRSLDHTRMVCTALATWRW